MCCLLMYVCCVVLVGCWVSSVFDVRCLFFVMYRVSVVCRVLFVVCCVLFVIRWFSFVGVVCCFMFYWCLMLRLVGDCCLLFVDRRC